MIKAKPKRTPRTLPSLAAFICERPDTGSRMSREAHVRFCERAVVKFRRATRLIVFGEAHLRRILGRYAAYYNESRIHRSLDKACPIPPAIEPVRTITSQPVLGGLHHHYCRI